MEWYTLNDALQRDNVIDDFESFIWTERYSEWGDFQLLIKSTPGNRSLLQNGVRLGMQQSQRVMRIESVTDTVGDDGTQKLTVTGRSIEHLLDDRVAMPALADLTTTPQWSITGTPGYIARYIFTQVCVNHVLGAGDVIPFYHSGTLNAAGGIAEPTETVTILFDPASVYNDIKKVCDMWLMGFRLVKDGDTGNVYFEVYTGTDRTSAQSAVPAVIFARNLESLTKASILKSIAAIKTVAYVFCPNGAAAVYADGYDSSVSGSDRRVVLVKADDIDLPAGSALNAAMNQRGLEELSKWREIYAVDGEIPQHLPYIYGLDYNLGDLVEERTEDGGSNYMLVTEQIFVSDDQGERTYPTLTLIVSVVPGSWRTQPTTEHWNDVPAGIHWNDFT